MTAPPDWHAADKVYQAHHSNCPTCRAAGKAPGSIQRCAEGDELWPHINRPGRRHMFGGWSADL